MGLRATRRKSPVVSVFALALAASASVVAPAAARVPPPRAAAVNDREAQRAELYRDAMKAAAAGRWAEAKERLLAVLAIRSSPKVLFSLAQTEEQLGQLASALGDYARALEAGAREGKEDVVRSARQAERALSARVPHVRVVLSGAAQAGGTATLDDQPVPLGAVVAVDPGDHRLAVSAPGLRAAIVSVTVTAGQQLDVPVSLESDPPASAVASSPSPRPPLALRPTPPEPSTDSDAKEASTSSPLPTAGLVIGGIGLVALGVGAVFGVASMEKHDDAQKVCPGATCSPSGASLWQDAVTYGDVSTGAFIAGGVGLVAGTALLLAAPKSNGAGPRVDVGLGSIRLRGTW